MPISKKQTEIAKRLAVLATTTHELFILFGVDDDRFEVLKNPKKIHIIKAPETDEDLAEES